MRERTVCKRPIGGMLHHGSDGDRRSCSLLRGHFSTRGTKHQKPRVEAAAGVEAQNAPTPAWKTHRTGFPQLPHALSSGCQSEGVSFSVVWGSKDPVA
jgi:hypothetical protein